MTVQRIGIIDLGSNSSRIVIYEVNDRGAYRPCYRNKRTIRLIHHMQGDKHISSEGIEQAVRCICGFRNIGEVYEVTHWIAVATAAVRQAANRLEIVEQLRKHTGISFRVLSGEEEAWYGYLGVINSMDVQDALLFDMGGASTEIVHIQRRQAVSTISLPFGSLNLAEKFAHIDMAHQLDAIGRFMKVQFSQIPWISSADNLPLIGIGGTSRALGKIARETENRRGPLSHGYEISRVRLQGIHEKIGQASVTERKKLGDLSETRAEVIHAGTATVLALADTVSAPKMFVSGLGLRDGLFFEYLFQQASSPVLASVRSHSVRNFLQLYGVNLVTADRIASMSVKLFDVLSPVHQLQDAHRDLIDVSARVDTTGSFVNVEKYTRHTDYLIHSSYLYGLSQNQLDDMGRVLTGKNGTSFKQLNMLIQLAKVLVLEMHLAPEEVVFKLNRMKKSLRIERTESGNSLLFEDHVPLQTDFLKLFGVALTHTTKP